MYSPLSIGDAIKLGLALIIGLAIGGSSGLFLGRWQGEAIGAAQANAESIRATNEAIGEITNEADKARTAFKLCRAANGVFDHGTGKCSTQ